MNWLTFLDIH